MRLLHSYIIGISRDVIIIAELWRHSPQQSKASFVVDGSFVMHLRWRNFLLLSSVIGRILFLLMCFGVVLVDVVA